MFSYTRLTYAVRISILVALAICTFAVQATVAQPPDMLRNYRFLPRHSVLHVQGGFGGFDIDANVEGHFAFVNGYRIEFPNIKSYAAFRHVDAVAINPTDFGPYSFDLDATLNLSGLEGEQLPVAAPFDVFKFRGHEGQEAPMDLTVIRLGRWLYMRGSNDAPCCDFFDYEIEAIARQIPYADFTRDDYIDRRDLIAWIRSFGRDGHGDSDNDLDSDGGDFLNWQRGYGEEMPSMEMFASLAAISAQQAALSAVPEPGTVALLTVIAICSGGVRYRNKIRGY